eukprot:TRINITY_DN1942_c0_g1_i3.p1 TRINITY_DN1942_c0_g1~~TRINITY_DN1942_c0_g1_i3.p1  ORF type:complete len:210 (-),score=39.36 TRINITY_DN1942_c0_g1_i3:101-730(-)
MSKVATIESSSANETIDLDHQVERVIANDLRIGSNVVINGCPCKIKDLFKSKPGKHGHAKVRVLAKDILNGKKYETIFASQATVDVPIIEKEDMIVESVNNEDLLVSLVSVPQPEQKVEVKPTATVLSRKEARKQKRDNQLTEQDNNATLTDVIAPEKKQQLLEKITLPFPPSKTTSEILSDFLTGQRLVVVVSKTMGRRGITGINNKS